MCIIAVLISAVGSASKRSLIMMFTVSGQDPGSGVKRRGQELDEVSPAIHGDDVAIDAKYTGLFGVFSD